MHFPLWLIFALETLAVSTWTPQFNPEDPGNPANVADAREFMADSSDEFGHCLSNCLAEYSNLEPDKCIEDYRGQIRYCMFDCADADLKRMRTSVVNWLRFIEFVPYWDCQYQCWDEKRLEEFLPP
ncbi:MAG: hypothetical protein M1816_000022 [Peltula sp. TS41687]|nr:MAG: hypothetical protein M1816_000022 [Peltula sp. TS41687]